MKKTTPIRFSEATLKFLLRAERARKGDWLEKNREEYEQVILEPLKNLASHLKGSLAQAAPRYHFPTKGIGRMKRPSNRVSGAPAEPSVVRGPPTTTGVIAIPAPHSGSGSGRWPRRGSGTGTGKFGCSSIGKGGRWARISCIVSTEKKA